MPTAGLIRMALAMPLHGILLLHALRSPVAREPSTIMACCALLRYVRVVEVASARRTRASSGIPREARAIAETSRSLSSMGVTWPQVRPSVSTV